MTQQVQGSTLVTEKIAFRKSLKFNLLVFSLAISMVPLIILMIFSILQNKAAMTEKIQSDLEVTAKAQGTSFANWMQEQLNEVKYIASLPEVKSFDQGQYEAVLQDAAKNFSSFGLFFLVDERGMQLYNTANEPIKDLSDRVYIQDALKGNSVIGDPVVSKANGRLLIPVAAPVMNENGDVIGVIGGTLFLDKLSESLKNLQFGKTGEVIFLNSEGFFLTDSRYTEELLAAQKITERAELELQVVSDDLTQAFSGTTSASINTDYRGEQAIEAFAPVKVANISWAMLTKQDTSEAFESTNRLIKVLVIALFIAIALVVTFSILYASHLTTILNLMVKAGISLSIGDFNLSGLAMEDRIKLRGRSDELGAISRSFTAMILYQKDKAEISSRISNGDLSVEVTTKSDHDELGKSMLQMVIGLRKLVGSVQVNAQNLGLAAEELSSAASQAAQATNQITMTIQHVAQGTQNQTEAVTKTSVSISQMTNAIDAVAKGAQEQNMSVAKASQITDQINSAINQVTENIATVTNDSNTAAEAARIGSSTVDQTLSGMESIKQKVGVSAEKVQEMGKRSQEIGAIVETIEDIASQTNLLALNAAIEAARAGEHGKGFAVVADEVRKLAERSTIATKEIGSMISGILSTVSEAVKAMEEGTKEVEQGVTNANLAGVALSDILTASEAVQKQASMAAEASKLMRVASEELVMAVDSVSAVVEENTSSTEEMAANSGEISQAVENIASVSEENSAAVEEVSASVEEMSAQVEEVTASTASLAEMAQMLKDAAAQFKLTSEG